MSEENHVKEYKNKVKILKQKELIIAFNNANPDRAKSKAEREQDEYFEAKKKALKEHFDAEVKNFEQEWKDKLIAYQNANKEVKKSILNQFMKQNNISRNKQNKEHNRAYKNALRLLNRDHCNAITKQWRENNKEKNKKYQKEYQKEYYEKKKALKLQQQLILDKDVINE